MWEECEKLVCWLILTSHLQGSTGTNESKLKFTVTGGGNYGVCPL